MSFLGKDMRFCLRNCFQDRRLPGVMSEVSFFQILLLFWSLISHSTFFQSYHDSQLLYILMHLLL